MQVSIQAYYSDDEFNITAFIYIFLSAPGILKRNEVRFCYFPARGLFVSVTNATDSCTPSKGKQDAIYTGYECCFKFNIFLTQ